MSLLEDVFLQDEAGEADDLERIIEGDEYQHIGSDEDDNGEPKEDEAEEDKRRVDPTSDKERRVVKNPRFTLNPARLTGPRGIQVIPEHFKDFKFKGKGHETEDLDMVLKTLEHWAYRLYPKFKFQDCLKKIEILGKKRPVAVHLHKIRSDQFLGDAVVQEDSSDSEPAPTAEMPVDEFDVMLQEQINNSTMKTPMAAKHGLDKDDLDLRSPLLMPRATSSPSISAEQKERMLRNRKLAEERRLARLANAQAMAIDNSSQIPQIEDNDNPQEPIENDHINSSRSKRPNVISSDSSDDEVSMIQNIDAQVHNDSTKDIRGHEDEDMASGDEERNNEDKEPIENDHINSSRSKRPNVISSDSSDDEVSMIQNIDAQVHNDSTKDIRGHEDEYMASGGEEINNEDREVEKPSEYNEEINEEQTDVNITIMRKDDNLDLKETTPKENLDAFDKLLQENNDELNKENLSNNCDVEMAEI